MSNLLTIPMKFIHSILQRWIAYCHIVRVMDLDQRNLRLWYQINTNAISQLKQSVSRKWLGLGRKNGLDQQLLSSLENDCPNNIGKSACSSFNPQSLSVFQILSADQLVTKRERQPWWNVFRGTLCLSCYDACTHSCLLWFSNLNNLKVSCITLTLRQNAHWHPSW